MKTITRVLTTAVTISALGSVSKLVWANSPADHSDIERGVRYGHAFQTGGYGQDQVAELDRQIQPYDLRVTFSEGGHAAYVAGVDVRITDAAGHQAFALDNAGPLMDVALQDGSYRVSVTFGGVERSQVVDVRTSQPQKLFLHWPKDET